MKDVVKHIWSLLTNPYHGLQEKQIKAIQNAKAAFQSKREKIQSSLYLTQSQGKMIDYQGLEYMMCREAEAWQYHLWYIKNHVVY